MNNGRIAAGHTHHLAAYQGGDLIHHALFIYIGNFYAGNRATARNIHRHLAVQNGNASRNRRLILPAFAVSGIDEGNFHAQPGQNNRILIGAIMTGGQHRRAPCHHPVSTGIAAQRPCQHHAGSVIIAKSKATLARPGGQNYVPGVQNMGDLARAMRIGVGDMVCQALYHPGDHPVIKAKSGRAEH